MRENNSGSAPAPVPVFTAADVRAAYERLDGAALGQMWDTDSVTYWQAMDDLAAERIAADIASGREGAKKVTESPYTIPEVRRALEDGSPERTDMIINAPYLYFTMARVLARGEVARQVARERERQAKQAREARHSRVGNFFRKLVGQ